MRRLPRWAIPPLAAATAFVVLVVAETVGIHVPGLGILGLFPRANAFDYSHGGFQGFSPLKRAFIDDVLGGAAPVAATTRPNSSRDFASIAGGDQLPRIVDEHSLTNDDRSASRSIPAVPYQARTDTAGATRDSSDPSDCSDVGNTLWYRYKPATDQQLIGDTVGTNRAVALGVFTGSGSRLTNIACDTEPSGNALVAFTARAHRVYLFQITDLAGPGNLVFTLGTQGRAGPTSLNAHGDPANESSVRPSVSANGRYIAFESLASNLDPQHPDKSSCLSHKISDGSTHYGSGDVYNYLYYATRTCAQVYVRDLATGAVRLGSVSSAGVAGNGMSFYADLSADGRYVAFSSFADNLLGPGKDTNGMSDVFVHDMKTGRTELVSVSSTGRQAERVGADDPATTWQAYPRISADGRFIVYQSAVDGLVPEDTDRTVDVFLYDRVTRSTTLVSHDDTGPVSDSATIPCISPDGRYIAYTSTPWQHVSGYVWTDQGGVKYDPGPSQVHVYNRVRHQTSHASVTPSGADANYESYLENGASCFSADDRYLVFESRATDLMPGDIDDAVPDVFVRDLERGTTTVASIAPDGRRAPWGHMAAISGNGRYVTFLADIKPESGVAESTPDVWMRDLATNVTLPVSLLLTRHDVDQTRDTENPDISSDGHLVVFEYRPLRGGYLPVRPAETNTYVQIYAYERSEFAR